MSLETTVPNITALRLYRQQIAHLTAKSPAEVVSALTALQGQDYPGALWSIGLRLPGAVEADVERAIAERAIVRTWPMRGTLHYVAAADVHWIMRLIAPRTIAGAGRRHAVMELDDAVIAQAEKVFVDALQGGNTLTREEMYAILDRAGISTANNRGFHVLWRLGQERTICFGPRSGNEATFTLLHEWIPEERRLERDEALAELADRYFRSHGPATLQDFTWWSGLKAADARAGLDCVSANLAKIVVNAKTYWMSPDAAPRQDVPPVAYLPPGFDEYLLGYQDRSPALEPARSNDVCPGGNGMFLGTVVVDGRVVGTWKRTLRKERVTITVSRFRELAKAERDAVDVAVERYGRYLGLKAEWA